MKLFKHQKNIISLNPRYFGLWWETGTGKSLALVGLAEKNVKSALLICPKSIKERWVRDAAKSSTKFTVVTKEEFRRDSLEILRYDALIIDEAHAFSNPKSKLHKAALLWCKKYRPDYVWLSTATPFRSTPWNAYALANLLGKQINYRQFRDTFFKERYLGHRTIWVSKETEESKRKLAEFFQSFGNTVRLDDCVDMPDAVFEYESIELSKEELQEIEILDEPNPIVRYSKIHQIENGTLKGNEYVPNWVAPQNGKIERILDIALETPKLAVFAKYTLQVESIANALAKCGHIVFMLTGATKDADKVIKEAEEAENAVIVINCAKAEGYELPSFKTVVYASLPWSLVEWTQSLGRFRRINKPQRVSYTILISNSEVDPAVRRALERKTDFQLKLFTDERKKLSS